MHVGLLHALEDPPHFLLPGGGSFFIKTVDIPQIKEREEEKSENKNPATN